MNLGHKKYLIKYKGKLYNLLQDGAYADKITIMPQSYAVLSNRPVNFEQNA